MFGKDADREKYFISVIYVVFLAQKAKVKKRGFFSSGQVAFHRIEKIPACLEEKKNLGQGFNDQQQKVQSTMSDVAERVKKIVIEHLGVDAAKVTENASFIDDLGADSLDTVELVMAFEEEFNVEIPDDAAEKIVTVKDAVDFIDQKKAA